MSLGKLLVRLRDGVQPKYSVEDEVALDDAVNVVAH